MRFRNFPLRSVVMAAVAIMMLVPLAAQAPAPKSQAPAPKLVYKPPPTVEESAKVPKGWTVPRTAWGDPDFQGLWSYATLTPMERPLSQADTDKLTPEEIKKIEETRWTRDDAEPASGSVGNYNAIWFDWGRSDGRTSIIVDPPNGRRPPLTPEGEKRLAARREYAKQHPADHWEDLPLALRCISYHGIPPIPSGYNNQYQIFQTPNYIVMYDESLTGPRRVYMNSDRPSKDVGLWNGDSRGRWDGNTLVVETTNFRPDAGSSFNLVLSQSNLPTLRVVERYTRLGPDLIENRFTVHDPATYTAPWTGVLYMPRFTDGPMYEYACHEGNISLPAVLAGARAEEKAGSATTTEGTRTNPR